MTCPWNNKIGNTFSNAECPILWHTMYPYFLGLSFNANLFKGDCCVCCPAEKGIDLMVKVRPYDSRFKGMVPEDWRDVIHAEVVRVHGLCDYGYVVGQIFLFPTFAKERHDCPAGIYNIFPFMDIKIPSCINKKKLRCPDWKEEVIYGL